MIAVVLPLMLVLAAGYATQRGSVCAVAATRELVVDGKAGRHAGFLLAAACSLAAVAGGEAAGLHAPSMRIAGSAAPMASLGGCLFALGAVINRRCALGTIADLGNGRIARLATVLGIGLGTAIATTALTRAAGMPAMPAEASPLAGVDVTLRIAGALVLGAFAALAAARLSPAATAGEWSAVRSMSVIGIVNGMLLCLAVRWPYTGLVGDLATGRAGPVGFRAALVGIFVAGAVAGGVRAGGFRIVAGPAADWLRSLAGGLVMGGGAALVPGGNDTMLLTGLPLAIPALALAYLAMTATLAVIVATQPRR